MDASNFFVLLVHCTSVGSGRGIGRYSILNDSDWNQVKKNLIGTSLIVEHLATVEVDISIGSLQALWREQGDQLRKKKEQCATEVRRIPVFV